VNPRHDVAALIAFWGLAASLSAADFYVGPRGNDTHVGNRKHPFATLERARDAVRGNRQSGATVTVLAGTYFLVRPLTLTEADSGTQAAPTIFRAAPGAAVRLTGGREVTGWRPVTDPDTLSRLPEAARGKVQFSDLPAQGITNYGRLNVRGFSTGNSAAEAELFYNDVPMTLARWPNQGFQGAKAKTDDQTVIVETDRLARWTAEAEPWVFAYCYHDWAELYEPLRGVDPAGHALLRQAAIKPVYGINPSRARWYAFNLFAELDAPGEYYLDRQTGRLFFWPPKPGGKAVLSMTETLVHAENTAYLTLQGFTIEACRSVAVSFQNTHDCKVVGCVVRNSGRAGVSFSGGSQGEVIGCDVYQTG